MVLSRACFAEADDAAETLMAFPRLDRMETMTAMGPEERARIVMELEEKDRWAT